MQEVTQLAYVAALRSGVALLREQDAADLPIMVLDFSNPFNFMLNAPAPRGDHLWYHVDRTISAETAPPAERLFASAGYVMIPKYPASPFTREFMLETYGAAVERDFFLLAENAHWRLLERRPAPAETAAGVP